jgi:hypothetical protein
MKPELHLKHKKRWKTDSQVVQKINMLRLSIANNKSIRTNKFRGDRHLLYR